MLALVLSSLVAASQQCTSVTVTPNGSTVAVHCRKTKPSPSPTIVPTSTPSPQPTQLPTSTPSPIPTLTPTPAPTETPTEQPTPSPSQAPTMYGCTVGAPWSTDVSDAPVLTNSAAMIKATIDGGGSMGFSVYDPTNETMNIANNATPMVQAQPKVGHPLPLMPWQNGYPIEPNSDAHALVLQTDTCQYYELYQATWKSPTLSAYGAWWGPLATWTRPSSGACSTATCIPIGPIAIRPEELAAGAITHALGWDAKAGSLGTSCVSPAAPTDCTDAYAYAGPPSEAANAMPYGSCIRLHANYDDSTFSPGAKAVAEAAKRYCSFAFDTSATGNVYPGVGTIVWSSTDKSDLARIHLSDYDVVNPFAQ